LVTENTETRRSVDLVTLPINPEGCPQLKKPDRLFVIGTARDSRHHRSNQAIVHDEMVQMSVRRQPGSV